MAPIGETIVPASEGLLSKPIRTQWHSLSRTTPNLRSFYQTPEWCHYRMAIGAKIDLLVRHGAGGEVLDVTPFEHSTYRLVFSIKNRTIVAKTFQSRTVLGNDPLFAKRSYHDWFQALATTGADCLCFFGVPTDACLYRQLTSSPLASWLPCIPNDALRFDWLELPTTFADYTAKFSAKSRKTLRHQSKHANVELTRVDAAQQVPDFVRAATNIAANSWQRQLLAQPLSNSFDRAGRLRDFADAGMLRAYLLTRVGQACAYVIGFQVGGVFTFFETAYDKSYADISPGRVLLYRLIKDLIEHDRPEKVFFGSWEADYKAFFGNASGTETDIILLRRTRANWLWWRAHQLFQAGVAAMKRVIIRNMQ